jgi:hypothetical protein
VLVEIAVVAPDGQRSSPFAIARLADPSRCPVLAHPLHARVSGVVGAMEVVLVHSDDAGDLRTYGREALVRALSAIAPGQLRWVPVELPESAGGGVDACSVAA